MIVWSGFGFVVAVFVLASSLLCNVLVDARFGAGYYSAHHWTIGVSLMLAGVLCALYGGKLLKGGHRDLVDAQTGERVVLRSRHTMFFIPVHLWGFVLGALGLALLASELFR